MAALTSELGERDRLLADLRQEIADREAAADGLARDRDDLGDALTTAREDMERLRGDLDQARGELDEARDALSSADETRSSNLADLNALEDEVRARVSEITRLTDQLDAAVMARSDMEQRVEDADRQLLLLQRELDELRTRLDNSERLASEQAGLLDSARRTHADEALRIDELKLENQNLADRQTELVDQLKRLENAASDAREQTERAERAEHEIDAIQHALDTRQAELDVSRQAGADLERRIETEVESHRAAAAARDDAEQAVRSVSADLDHVRSILETTRQQLDESREQQDGLRSALNEREDAVAALNRDLDERDAELDMRVAERDALTLGIDELGTALADQSEAAAKDVADAAARFESLKNWARTLETGQLEQTGALVDSQALNVELQDALDSARAQIDQTGATLAEHTARVSELETRLEDADREHQADTARHAEQLTELETRARELQHALDTAASESADASRAIEERDARLRELTDELAAADRRQDRESEECLQELQVELDALRAEAERAYNHARELEAELEARDRHEEALVAEHDERNATFQEQSAQLRNALDTAQAELDEAGSRIAELERDVEARSRELQSRVAGQNDTERAAEQDRGALDAMTAENARLTAELSDRDERLEELAVQLESRDRQLEEVVAEHDDRDTALEQHAESVHVLEEELAQAMAQRRETQSAAEVMEQTLRDALSELEAQLQEKDMQVRTLEDRRATQPATAVAANKPEGGGPAPVAPVPDTSKVDLRNQLKRTEAMLMARTRELDQLRWKQSVEEKGGQATDERMLLVLNQQLTAAREEADQLRAENRELKAERRANVVGREEGGAEPDDASTALASATSASELPVARKLDLDLTAIRGIGPKLAVQLNDLGVRDIEQIAAIEAEELGSEDHVLHGFQGRILRDGWIEQASALLHQH